MDTELRPLNLGEILDRIFHLYRSQFLMFAGISTVAAGLDLAWKLIQTSVVQAIQHHVTASTLVFINAGLSLVNLLVYVVASSVAMAAINRAVSAIYLGKATGIVQSYQETKAHWLRYVGLYVLAATLAWGGTILAFVAIIFGTILLPGAVRASPFGVFAIFGLSILLFVPFGIWMSLRYSLANPACVSEDLGIRASLKRSASLSRGATEKLKIFTLLFLAWVISAVITYAGLAPVLFVTISASLHHNQPVLSLAETLYTLLVGFVTTSITTPIYSIGLTLFYYDRRIRKEGFDVEWLMQRATPPPPPPLVLPEAPVTESPIG
jgi:hypothetical protein